MDLRSATNWEPPDNWRRLIVIDSHTGGEPFRLVVDGLPDIPGDTVLERRRYAIDHLDDLRRQLMFEPRGHADMYGGWIGPPVGDDSDLSVLFLHNEGFSTMCGHGIIALTTIVLETGVVAPTAQLRIDTPAGQVTAIPRFVGSRVEEVSFHNVPSFVTDLDVVLSVPGFGEVSYDLAFGGAFYAYVDVTGTGLSLDNASGLITAGRAIKDSVTRSRAIIHPTDPDLGFLYGVIFTGGAADPNVHSRHVCVFADGEVDRSPTGTGVSGRLAILHRRGDVGLDETIRIESIVGSVFSGRVVDLTSVGDFPAIIPEVTGSAHILGRTEHWFDPDDDLGDGFLLR